MMWKQAVERLGERVSSWAAPNLTVVVHDPEPGESYLEMRGDQGRFYLEPAEFAGREMPAIVWLYAYPTLRRVRLCSEDGDSWSIQSSDGIPFHRMLTQESFVDLIRDLSINVA